MSAAPHQSAVVARMAARLLHLNVASEREAIMALMSGGFAAGDVMALLDDALAAARQSAVTAIMRAG